MKSLMTPTHEWIFVNGDVATIGISKKARDELGEIVFVKLPSMHETLKEGDELAILESTKAAVDLYTPISGEIIAINENLVSNPSLINDSPEEKGWICKIKMFHLDELNKYFTNS